MKRKMSFQLSGCHKHTNVLSVSLILVVCLAGKTLAAPAAAIKSSASASDASSSPLATPIKAAIETTSPITLDAVNSNLNIPLTMSGAETELREIVPTTVVSNNGGGNQGDGGSDGDGKNNENAKKLIEIPESTKLKEITFKKNMTKNRRTEGKRTENARKRAEEAQNKQRSAFITEKPAAMSTTEQTQLAETEPDIHRTTLGAAKNSSGDAWSRGDQIDAPAVVTKPRKLKRIKSTVRTTTATTTTTSTTTTAARATSTATTTSTTEMPTTNAAIDEETTTKTPTTLNIRLREMMSSSTTSIIPTDPYFISGLSDLLLESNGFERIKEIEARINKMEMNIYKNAHRRRLMTPPPSPFVPPTDMDNLRFDMDSGVDDEDDDVHVMVNADDVVGIRDGHLPTMTTTTAAPIERAAATTLAAATDEAITRDDITTKSNMDLNADVHEDDSVAPSTRIIPSYSATITPMPIAITTSTQSAPVVTTGVPAIIKASAELPEAPPSPVSPEKEIKTIKSKNINQQQSVQTSSQQLGKKKLTKFASGKKNKLKKIASTTTTTTPMPPTTTTMWNPITKDSIVDIPDFVTVGSVARNTPSPATDDLIVEMEHSMDVEYSSPPQVQLTERLGSTIFATTSAPTTAEAATDSAVTEFHEYHSTTITPSAFEPITYSIPTSASSTSGAAETQEIVISTITTEAQSSMPSSSAAEVQTSATTTDYGELITRNTPASSPSVPVEVTSPANLEMSSTILAVTTDRTTTLLTPHLIDVVNPNSTSYIDIDIIEDVLSPGERERPEVEEKNDDIFIKVSGVGNINITTEHKKTEANGNNNESLEITLIEDEINNPGQIIEILETTTKFSELENTPHPKTHANLNHPGSNGNDFSTTIQFEVPTKPNAVDENGRGSAMDSGPGRMGKESEYNEDEIKIKTTDKDSDTIFYISNTEVKVSESIPTPQTPNGKPNQENPDQQFFPAVFEEDVIIDIPNKNNASGSMVDDKYEADIILSPLNSNGNNYMPIKDLSYIAESFLEAEQQQQHEQEEQQQQQQYPHRHRIHNQYEQNIDIVSSTEITSSSDVIIQPGNIPESPLTIGVPVIAELPPQIELEEMIFSSDNEDLTEDEDGDDEYSNYDKKLIPNMMRKNDKAFLFYNNNLIKNSLSAEIPPEKLNETLPPSVSASAVALANSHKMQSTNKSSNANGTNPNDPLVNTTAFLVENDELSENGFTDLQTLFLACFATLAPLLLSVLFAFGVRHFWRKYRRQRGLGNGLLGDKSTDPLAAKSVTGSVDELKTSESRSSLTRSNKEAEANGEIPTAVGNEKSSIVNHSGTNGSIITMTMKNNHLIVETEERNDISRDTRETKMHYSPSEKDGVFVVESARGADINDNYKCNGNYEQQQQQPQPSENRPVTDLKPSSSSVNSTAGEHQEVLVHTPPDGLNGDEEASALAANTGKRPSTGLSQSDLSDSSSNDSNQNYCYGSQDIYNVESKNYDAPSPIITRPRFESLDANDSQPLIESAGSPDRNPDKPIITAAIYKEDAQNAKSSFVEGGESLQSDVTALAENQIKKDKKDRKEKEDAAIQEEQIRLGNGVVENGVTGEEEPVEATNGETNNNSIIQDKCGEILMTDPSSTTLPAAAAAQLDSLSFLPEPPTSDEIKQLNELTAVLDLTQQLDSLPPPPPPAENNSITVNNSIPITVNGISES